MSDHILLTNPYSLSSDTNNYQTIESSAEFSYNMSRGLIKGQALGKLTICENDIARLLSASQTFHKLCPSTKSKCPSTPNLNETLDRHLLLHPGCLRYCTSGTTSQSHPMECHAMLQQPTNKF